MANEKDYDKMLEKLELIKGYLTVAYGPDPNLYSVQKADNLLDEVTDKLKKLYGDVGKDSIKP